MYRAQSKYSQAMDFDSLFEAKQRYGGKVSLVIPAHNEAATLSGVLQTLMKLADGKDRFFDETLVVDDNSSDETATIARALGARLVKTSQFFPHHGKGQALFCGLKHVEGQLIVTCDADLSIADPISIASLALPLMRDPRVQLVKAAYSNTESELGDKLGGGRVTELLARPLLKLFFPSLASIVSPLSGEMAMRKSLFQHLALESGYAVDVAILIDVATSFSRESIVEIEFGEKLHRHRGLAPLSTQAEEVMQAILRRAGVLDKIGPTGKGRLMDVFELPLLRSVAKEL